MTQEDLIETAALELYDMQEQGMWEFEEESTRGTYRAYARAMLRGVVAFVAEWIGNQSGVNIVAEDCEYTVKAWQEEMAS